MGGPPFLYGFAVCECIRDSYAVVEARLERSLNGLISQGCYSTSVAASGQTHAGGGVLDLRDWSRDLAWVANVLTVECGWVDFYRPAGILYAGSSSHHHVVVNGCPHLDPTAAAQLVDAERGRNGLASHGPLLGPRPDVTWARALEIFQEEQMALTDEQANQLASVYKALFVSGGDVGPVTVLQRLSLIEGRLDTVESSIQELAKTPVTVPTAEQIVAAAIGAGAAVTITKGATS